MASATTTQRGINYNGILTDLRLTDKEDFRRFLRMNTETFQVKLSNVFLEAATKAVSKNNTGSKKIALLINSFERFHFVAFRLVV